MKKLSSKGFSAVETALVIAAIILIALVGWHIHRVHRRAEQARASSLITKLNVSYGSDPKQILDIYEPHDTSAVRPIVVTVHGGGWRAGDKSVFSNAAGTIAHAGFSVFNINYRLDSATQPGFPMEVDDVEAAVNWAIQNGPMYGGDVHNLMLMGGSAGGNLVDLAGPLLNQRQPHTVAAVVSLSGPTDMVAWLNEFLRTNSTDTKTYQQHLSVGSQLIGCDLSKQECPLASEQAVSPIYNVTASNCPAFLIFNSQNEVVPLSQATSFNDKLQQLKCPSTLKVLPGTAHSIAYFPSQQSTIIDFLKAH